MLAPKAPASNQPKKIVIKPFKVQPALPEDFEREACAKLDFAISAIQKKEPFPHSEEELYRLCHDLCMHKKGEIVYSRLHTACENHIRKSIVALADLQVTDDEFLVCVKKLWDDHCSQMLDIRLIFLSLDCSYVVQTANSKTRFIWNMGLEMFRQFLCSTENVMHRTVRALIATIHNERRGQAIDHSLCANVIRMFVNLQVYKERFHGPFLFDSSSFFREEAASKLPTLEVCDYLIHVERRLQEESDRCQRYLEPATTVLVLKTVEKDLLSDAIAKELVNKGFDMLFEQNRIKDLQRLYSLLLRVRAVSLIRQALCAHILRVGAATLQSGETNTENSTTASNSNSNPNSNSNTNSNAQSGLRQIQCLIDLRLKQDNLLAVAFEDNKDFVNALQETWEKMMNEKSSYTAEQLAKFVDAKLKKGESGGDGDLEVVLDHVMMLFRHLQAKDVFEAFYMKDLAKRLIMQKYSSIDAENAMISKLKSECGNVYTAKLESMFRDMEVSKDIMTSFMESKARQSLGDVSLDVKVLTTNCWPTYPPCGVDLPLEVSKYQDMFQKFYLQKHNGRCLKWQPFLGTAMLLGSFKTSNTTHSKELHVSMLQAVCLLDFNRSQNISFEELKARTRIADAELRRTLQSLACGKIRVLKKTPKGKEVEDHDTFCVDVQKIIENKMFRLKIPNIQAKETPEENVKTHEGVVQDRQYQIDAALVRIMKTRKTLSHNQLVAQLFDQLKVPVKTQDLKKRIESLIDREYMQRDKSQHSVYHYMA